MREVFSALQKLMDGLHSALWGAPLLALLLGAGLYLTLRLRFFQLRRAPAIFREAGRAFFGRKKGKEGLSPLQAMSTALAATIGTGNIAGVAAAITLGGPGAIFWMWVSAFFGMMTAFGENVLGARFQSRDAAGRPVGGAMYYLRDGLKNRRLLRPLAKPLSLAYALFCALAALGMGNMTQVNSIAAALEGAFRIPAFFTGLVVTLLAALVIFGGIARIGRVTEKLVPFMALAYMAACLAALLINARALPGAFRAIFEGAFGYRAALGGFSGAALKKAFSVGIRRGVFSNEAGLGSSVMAHAAADGKAPLRQGMWAIFEVFFDTILLCTLTALVILSSGVLGSVDAAGQPVDGAPLVQLAFAQSFHQAAGAILGAAVALFAFATLLGWSCFGAAAAEFALGRRAVKPYRILFLLCILPGAVMELGPVWTLSDLFNGLMALPNLVGLFALSGTILKITKESKEC